MFIIVSEEETATNTDMLAGTALETIPANGVVLVEACGADCIAANHYTLTFSVGDVIPLNGTLVTSHSMTAGTTGILDDNTSLNFKQRVAKGDKIMMACTETGDTELVWRVTFSDGIN